MAKKLKITLDRDTVTIGRKDLATEYAANNPVDLEDVEIETRTILRAWLNDETVFADLLENSTPAAEVQELWGSFAVHVVAWLKGWYNGHWTVYRVSYDRDMWYKQEDKTRCAFVQMYVEN